MRFAQGWQSLLVVLHEDYVNKTNTLNLCDFLVVQNGGKAYVGAALLQRLRFILAIHHFQQIIA